MPRADFVTGLILLVVAFALLGEGWRLPGAVGVVPVGGEAGRVLIFIGMILGTLSLILVLRAVAAGGHRISVGPFPDSAKRTAALRAAATALGGVLYVALLGRKPFGIELNYSLLTFAFVFFFIVIAEWKLAKGISAQRWHTLNARAPGMAARIASASSFIPEHHAPYVWLTFTSAVQAALIAIVVTYVFEKQFLVTLP